MGAAADITIRAEQSADAPAVARVNERAFGGPAEAQLVGQLRAAGGVTLSLVACAGERVVGHALFSPVAIETAAGTRAAVGLGPLAVVPEQQRTGIGTRLVQVGLEQLRRDRHEIAVVLGHPAYYPRFGFVAASRFGLRCEFDCPDEAFMALELRPGALAACAGVARYRAEFSGF